jgi:pimeloyl-ACP methyl ester carboxylesterase
MDPMLGRVEVSYDDVGSGEPALLLLPGWCADRSVYLDLVRHLASRFRVLALDWRGHGRSPMATGEFGEAELVDDARSVIERSGARSIIPVAQAHAGWVAIALRRRLGLRVRGLVLLEWLVLGAPPSLLTALQRFQSPAHWRDAVDRTFAQWLEGNSDPRLTSFVRGRMGSHGYPMWARAARAIQTAYAREGSPLAALGRLDPPAPVLHLYGRPRTPDFLVTQQGFARSHAWFRVELLEARSHFPMLERPAAIANAIDRFALQNSLS